MKRPVRNGKDPFGRSFGLDLEACRRKWAIQDKNRTIDSPAQRKSVPSEVLKLSRP